ncbi:28S ribosomal protein S34, mitochondrial [Trichoplax sp. H2]|nr:28S ribosomal protein S34, mitochondrial [Trichoplax sp. H2]|eukprot:RDD41229.1 28S ribosomal protein S34, mitochondrial [Trichoplax sp. H2]
MLEPPVMRKLNLLLKGRSLANLPNVLNRLKYYGIGKKVTRAIWLKYDEPSYWTITRVSFKRDMYHANAWGIFTFRGKTEEQARKIRSCRKRQWLVLEGDDQVSNPFVGKRKWQQKQETIV